MRQPWTDLFIPVKYMSKIFNNWEKKLVRMAALIIVTSTVFSAIFFYWYFVSLEKVRVFSAFIEKDDYYSFRNILIAENVIYKHSIKKGEIEPEAMLVKEKPAVKKEEALDAEAPAAPPAQEEEDMESMFEDME